MVLGSFDYLHRFPDLLTPSLSVPSLFDHEKLFFDMPFFSNVIRWRLLRTERELESDSRPILTLRAQTVSRKPQQLEWLLRVSKPSSSSLSPKLRTNTFPS